MKIFTTLLFFLVGVNGSFGKDPALSLFEAGNIAFQDGRFGQATTNYQAHIDKGIVSAPLHYNLATAAFYNDQLGLAIFHYRQARLLSPRDQNTRHNLKLARDEVHNGSPPKPGLWQSLTGFLTLNEWTLLASLPLVTWLIWLTAINLKPAWKKRGAIIRPLLGAIAIILSLITTFTWYQRSTHNWAVINGETVARFGPVKASPDQFKWFDGTEVEIDRIRGNWLLARDITGRQGWVHSESVFRPGS